MSPDVWNLYPFTLNMPTAMYAETTEEFQYTTRLNHEKGNYARGLEAAGVPPYCVDDIASSVFFRCFP
jgi:hypothetical protein